MTTTKKPKRTRAEVAAESAVRRAEKAKAVLARWQEQTARAAARRDDMRERILRNAREFGGDITEGQLRAMGRGYMAAAASLAEIGKMIRLNAQGDGARYGLADVKALTA